VITVAKEKTTQELFKCYCCKKKKPALEVDLLDDRMICKKCNHIKKDEEVK